MTVYNLNLISLNSVFNRKMLSGSHLAGEGGGGLAKWPINDLHFHT